MPGFYRGVVVRKYLLYFFLCLIFGFFSAATTIQSSSSSSSISSSSVSILLNPSPSQVGSATNTITSSYPYHIPHTSLHLILETRGSSLNVEDTLILLINAIFSATRIINAGGAPARNPVHVVTHKYRSVQLQMVGYNDRLTPFKTAAIFEGMAVVGSKIGYLQSSITVLENLGYSVERIAKVDIA